MPEWKGYILADFEVDLPAASRVLDVGCGPGHQMDALDDAGMVPIGMDIDVASVEDCRRRGHIVFRSLAESIPLEDESIDGVHCKVVLSYTDERRAIAECSRVLKRHGTLYLISHGAGYYLRYLLRGESMGKRFYGLRAIVNTWFYAFIGKRLPAFMGDTIYQSHARLEDHFHSNSLRIVLQPESRRFLGRPVFIYQVLQKA